MGKTAPRPLPLLLPAVRLARLAPFPGRAAPPALPTLPCQGAAAAVPQLLVSANVPLWRSAVLSAPASSLRLLRPASRRDAPSPVPLDPEAPRRSRTRRGGARTPLPLLPLIGVIAGVAMAYVSQTAHLTQATYQVSSLSAEQAQLRAQDAQVTGQLERMRSASRIDAAAQGMGMRPSAKWNYIAAAPEPIQAAPAQRLASAPGDGSDAVQRLVAALEGSFGNRQAAAAGR